MKLWRQHLRRLSGRDAPFLAEPAMEDVYRHLFTRDLALLGLPDIFCPTGGAANYSLLYVILRVAVDHRPRRVLDIGAGQSSLLWNALRGLGLVDEVVTLEHDPEWAKLIGEQIGHTVLVTALRPWRIGAVQTLTYDWKAVKELGAFDAVICDGPNGVPRLSRYGVVAMLDQLPSPDFLLVLDDVERSGEQDTVGAIHDRLGAIGVHYASGIVRAAKSQAVFATGRFMPICHV